MDTFCQHSNNIFKKIFRTVHRLILVLFNPFPSIDVSTFQFSKYKQESYVTCLVGSLLTYAFNFFSCILSVKIILK